MLCIVEPIYTLHSHHASARSSRNGSPRAEGIGDARTNEAPTLHECSELGDAGRAIKLEFDKLTEGRGRIGTATRA